MAGPGRKKDNIWMYFEEQQTSSGKGVKAKCKNCNKIIMGIVVRMKKHVNECLTEDLDSTDCDLMSNCPKSSNTDVMEIQRGQKRKSIEKSIPKNSISNFFTKTTSVQKEKLDEHIARYIYATNSAFHTVKHPMFKKMVSELRPGYIAPNEAEIGGNLLNRIYEQEKIKCSEYLAGQIVNLSIDGWSNVHNEPILCAVVTNNKGETYLVDTIDTSGHPHTAEYLVDVVANIFNKCETEFKCSIRSIVTDNAANIKKMRTCMESKKNLNIITYGYSAHLLNLLAEHLNITSVKEQIV